MIIDAQKNKKLEKYRFYNANEYQRYSWVEVNQHDRVYRDMKQQKLDKDSILAVSCHAASSLAKCCLY